LLALPGLGEALATARRRGVPVVAMSGIIGGVALKGPADRMLASLGHESSALGVARLYREVATAFVADAVDAASVPAIEALGLQATAFDTVMSDDAARARVAGDLLRWIG
jgi:LPPG:FO 2-phospho-L-lactate transferase